MEQPETGVPDTADIVDPNVPDPTPPEITDRSHPDYVNPFIDATSVVPEGGYA